jgi:hypothetical protein
MVADYVYRLHDQIIDRGFYEDVEHHPVRQVSVEVACALEKLTRPMRSHTLQTLSGATASASARDSHTCSDCKAPTTERNGERGGFGISMDDGAQRIDVTGHAARAFMKSIENGIEGGSPKAYQRHIR